MASPFVTVQVSFSGVIAKPPVWVNGSYWKTYDLVRNGVSAPCTSSYPTSVANLPKRNVVPSGPTFGRNASTYAWNRSIGYGSGPPFGPEVNWLLRRLRAMVN